MTEEIIYTEYYSVRVVKRNIKGYVRVLGERLKNALECYESKGFEVSNIKLVSDIPEFR